MKAVLAGLCRPSTQRGALSISRGCELRLTVKSPCVRHCPCMSKPAGASFSSLITPISRAKRRIRAVGKEIEQGPKVEASTLRTSNRSKSAAPALQRLQNRSHFAGSCGIGWCAGAPPSIRARKCRREHVAGNRSPFWGQRRAQRWDGGVQNFNLGLGLCGFAHASHAAQGSP